MVYLSIFIGDFIECQAIEEMNIKDNNAVFFPFLQKILLFSYTNLKNKNARKSNFVLISQPLRYLFWHSSYF